MEKHSGLGWKGHNATVTDQDNPKKQKNTDKRDMIDRTQLSLQLWVGIGDVGWNWVPFKICRFSPFFYHLWTESSTETGLDDETPKQLC